MPEMEEGNVGLAFGMVVGAGMCTSVGAAAAFCVNLESKRFLAVSLALSAGVMFYVSMVEIFFKALSALSDEYCPGTNSRSRQLIRKLRILRGVVAVEVPCDKIILLTRYPTASTTATNTERATGDPCPIAYGATTGYFFLGIALTTALNVLTSQLGKCSGVKNPTGHDKELEPDMYNGSPGLPDTQPLPPGWEVKLTHGTMKPLFYHPASKEWSWTFPGLQGGGSCACDVTTAPSFGRPTAQGDLSTTILPTSAPVPMLSTQAFGVYPQTQAFGVYPPTQAFGVYPSMMTMGSGFGGSSLEIERNHPEVEEKAKLNATGLLTGVAIAIHNFPEGLATFVAAMAVSLTLPSSYPVRYLCVAIVDM